MKDTPSVLDGSREVIQTLQFALAAEAHLNLQYRMDERLFKFMGVKKCARKAAKLGDDAHDYMRFVTKRLLILGGDPGYNIDRVVQMATVTAVFENELALEKAILGPYEQAVQTAMKALDDASRNLFEHLLAWHQKGILYLAQQVNLIAGLGEAEYIAEKL